MALSDLVIRFSRRNSSAGPFKSTLYPRSLVRVLGDDELDAAIEKSIASEWVSIETSTARIAQYERLRPRGVVVQMSDAAPDPTSALAHADSA